MRPDIFLLPRILSESGGEPRASQVGQIDADLYFKFSTDAITFPVPYEFFVSGIKFKITDVGGDREQRQNWIDVMGVGRTLVTSRPQRSSNYFFFYK